MPMPDHKSDRPQVNGLLPVLRYNPLKEGLQRWFGPTETMVMLVIWSPQKNKPIAVRPIMRALEIEHGHALAYTSVMTTATRLWEKGMLSRQWIAGAYEYAPRETREEFVNRQIKAIEASL
mgnify:CR=1 FL=1